MVRVLSENPLRILFLSSNMPWRGGGTFYRAYGFARHLVKRGHEVTLMVTSLDSRKQFIDEIHEGVRVVQSPGWLTGKMRSGWDLYEVRRCRQWLNGRTFDLIHGFESRPVVIYPALYAQEQNQAALILDWCDWLGKGGFIEEQPAYIRLPLRPIENLL